MAKVRGLICLLQLGFRFISRDKPWMGLATLGRGSPLSQMPYIDTVTLVVVRDWEVVVGQEEGR
jgi:hypothetical protein